MLKGKLITIEGLEGAGKTTLINKLKTKLKNNKNVIFTSETAPSVGKDIYNLIHKNKLDPITHLFLCEAARREHFVNVIFPALQDGKIVIMDKFIDATMAYYGFHEDIGINYIKECNNLATSYSNLQLLNIYSVKPDLTIFLDVEFKTAQKRLRAQAQNNLIDRLNIEEFASICNGYEKSFLQRSNSHKVEIIDVTTLSKEEVLKKVTRVLGEFFKDVKKERDHYSTEMLEEISLMRTLQSTRIKKNLDEFLEE